MTKSPVLSVSSPVCHRASLDAQRGSTLLGLIAGLIIGLGVALAVALYVSHAPVPFVSRAPRVAQRTPSAIADNAELPDPNRALYSQEGADRFKPGSSPGIPTSSAPGVSGPSVSGPIDTGMMDDKAHKGDQSSLKASARAPVIPDLPVSRPVSPDGSPDAPAIDISQTEAPSVPNAPSYFLQVGAYRSKEDADSNRARLTMQGFDVKVLSAEVNGNTIYRVRLGPYPKLDELNRVRSKLAENNVEVSIVKTR